MQDNLLIKIFRKLYVLWISLFLIYLNNKGYNCEETDQKMKKFVKIVYSSKKDAFVFEPTMRRLSNFNKRSFSSHNPGIPWHVETNMYGEVIVPDEHFIIKSPFLKRNQRIDYEKSNLNKNSFVVKRSFVSNISDENVKPVTTPEKSVLTVQEISTLVSLHDNSFTTPSVDSASMTQQSIPINDLKNPDILWRNLNALLHDGTVDIELTTFTTTSQTNIDPAQPIGNPEHLKQDCEDLYHRNCICSFKQILTDFENILTTNPGKKVLTVDIVNYKCKSFLPIPENFSLSSDMKPKVLSKTKGLVIDDGKGPKEINQRSIEDLLSFDLEDEGTVIYAFPNTNVVLPCFPSEDVHLSANTNDNTNYTWTHGNHKAITEGRIATDVSHMGRLTIHEINLSDSDNYTCEVKYVNPDTGHYSNEQFVHTVIVVSLPVIVLHAVVHYKAALKCEESILEMFELYLPQQIEQAVCDAGEGKFACDVNVHNPVCHTDFVARNNRDLGYLGNNGFSSYWRRFKHQAEADSMEMSLNFEVQVHSLSDLLQGVKNTSHCNPNCRQKVNLKLIQLIRENFPDVLPIQVTWNLGTTFEPMPHSIAVKYVAGCLGGYELLDGFCTPCKKEHYSEDGDTSCSSCPRGSYQNQVGARSCIECKNHWIPACNEFTDEYNMVIVLVVFGTVTVLFLTFCLLYVCCLREKDTSAQDSCIQSFAPCMSPKVKKPRGKLGKSARYQKKRVVIQSDESEPLITDDSEPLYEDTRL